MNEQVQDIFIEDIIPNRFQPRLTFDEKALQELSDSIKVHGVIQPLVLRKVGNKYEIIAGERRYKASCLAGLKKVPAIVREMTDNESAEVALIENVQRKNLSSIEEAQSYRNLLDRGYLTQEELAQKLGVSQPTIANKMRLLNLCDEVQNALLNEQISERHARSLLSLSNPDDQKNMLNRIIKERLTVKQLDNEIKKMTQGGDTNPESGGMVMEPTLENDISLETNDLQENKNIFGFSFQPPTDLEESAPNLTTGLEEPIPPVSFNPFSADTLKSELDSSIESTPIIDNDEQLETFDFFGNDFAPNNSSNSGMSSLDNIPPIDSGFSVPNAEPQNSSFGDQISNVRNAVKEVEKAGFRVEMEEYDFEDMYQIVVKVKK